VLGNRKKPKKNISRRTWGAPGGAVSNSRIGKGLGKFFSEGAATKNHAWATGGGARGFSKGLPGVAFRAEGGAGT